ncbi:hypothetical protein DL768_010646 [Monosporascus sp. mg162]|nr:hypothetical protein DL768_010646 [Monosporascus sp. mg162]
MPTFTCSVPESSPWKYFPFDLGECEDLENYEPGGFHPVYLGDAFDDRYRVIHKLGFGGFSTVWLARDALTNRESPTYKARMAIGSHSSITESGLFAVVDREFWFNGPNGRHLCLVYPVLGPDLSKLSKGIYTRIKPRFAKEVSLLAARALAYVHSNGLCHGVDFTVSNIALRLIDGFNSYEEGDLLNLFGRPQTAPMRTYSGKPPGSHAPNYITVPLDFSSSKTNVPGIPAKYLAPKVAVGQPASRASDVWAPGCAIFRIRSGDDIFFDYDTNCPADALRQVVKTVGELPEKWRQTRFDEKGFPVAEDEDGEVFWSLEEAQPLDDRVRTIVDEPAGLFINGRDEALEAVDMDEEPAPAMFDNDAALRVPYPAALGSMVWKPTAICIDGSYFTAHSDETYGMLEAFPRIAESEASLLVDLPSKIFTYEPAKRIKAEELVTHPWFHSIADSG